MNLHISRKLSTRESRFVHSSAVPLISSSDDVCLWVSALLIAFTLPRSPEHRVRRDAASLEVPQELFLNTKEHSNAAAQRLRMQGKKRDTLTVFIAGASSAACSALLFQPLDLVKTRMQVRALATPLCL